MVALKTGSKDREKSAEEVSPKAEKKMHIKGEALLIDRDSPTVESKRLMKERSESGEKPYEGIGGGGSLDKKSPEKSRVKKTEKSSFLEKTGSFEKTASIMEKTISKQLAEKSKAKAEQLQEQELKKTAANPQQKAPSVEEEQEIKAVKKQTSREYTETEITPEKVPRKQKSREITETEIGVSQEKELVKQRTEDSASDAKEKEVAKQKSQEITETEIITEEENARANQASNEMKATREELEKARALDEEVEKQAADIVSKAIEEAVAMPVLKQLAQDEKPEEKVEPKKTAEPSRKRKIDEPVPKKSSDSAPKGLSHLKETERSFTSKLTAVEGKEKAIETEKQAEPVLHTTAFEDTKHDNEAEGKTDLMKDTKENEDAEAEGSLFEMQHRSFEEEEIERAEAVKRALGLGTTGSFEQEEVERAALIGKHDLGVADPRSFAEDFANALRRLPTDGKPTLKDLPSSDSSSFSSFESVKLAPHMLIGGVKGQPTAETKDVVTEESDKTQSVSKGAKPEVESVVELSSSPSAAPPMQRTSEDNNNEGKETDAENNEEKLMEKISGKDGNGNEEVVVSAKPPETEGESRVKRLSREMDASLNNRGDAGTNGSGARPKKPPPLRTKPPGAGNGGVDSVVKRMSQELEGQMADFPPPSPVTATFSRAASLDTQGPPDSPATAWVPSPAAAVFTRSFSRDSAPGERKSSTDSRGSRGSVPENAVWTTIPAAFARSLSGDSGSADDSQSKSLSRESSVDSQKDAPTVAGLEKRKSDILDDVPQIPEEGDAETGVDPKIDEEERTETLESPVTKNGAGRNDEEIVPEKQPQTVAPTPMPRSASLKEEATNSQSKLLSAKQTSLDITSSGKVVPVKPPRHSSLENRGLPVKQAGLAETATLAETVKETRPPSPKKKPPPPVAKKPVRPSGQDKTQGKAQELKSPVGLSSAQKTAVTSPTETQTTKPPPPAVRPKPKMGRPASTDLSTTDKSAENRENEMNKSTEVRDTDIAQSAKEAFQEESQEEKKDSPEKEKTGLETPTGLHFTSGHGNEAATVTKQSSGFTVSTEVTVYKLVCDHSSPFLSSSFTKTVPSVGTERQEA